jgi:hypothetical protein
MYDSIVFILIILAMVIAATCPHSIAMDVEKHCRTHRDMAGFIAPAISAQLTPSNDACSKGSSAYRFHTEILIIFIRI